MNFKAHFKDAQKVIKRSQLAITTDYLGSHGQVNAASALATQVLAEMTAQCDSEAAALQLAKKQAQ